MKPDYMEIAYIILEEALDAAYIEANEEHDKVDALRKDVKRLRELLKRCMPQFHLTAGECGLYDEIQDELAKE